jgi:hypothetical protein
MERGCQKTFSKRRKRKLKKLGSFYAQGEFNFAKIGKRI